MAKQTRVIDLSEISTLALLRNLPASAPGALDAISTELIRREKLFREQIENALAAIEGDERLGYPVATVNINAPLALVQCGLESQRRALKYVLEALAAKDGVE